MASEGLVLTLPNRSTIVAPLDFSSVPEYLDALDIHNAPGTGRRLCAGRKKNLIWQN
ncbi:hypothetical protein NKJ36_32215 [Mesorhizobium sp. M0142]